MNNCVQSNIFIIRKIGAKKIQSYNLDHVIPFTPKRDAKYLFSSLNGFLLLQTVEIIRFTIFFER